MMLRLSREKMLERWMLFRGLGPVRGDAAVVRTDGLDLERLMEDEMRRWYVRLLDEADARLLPTDDVAGEATLKTDGAGGAVIALPERARRGLGLRMSHWKREAVIAAEGSAEARRQDNRLARGGAWRPVAIAMPGGCLRVTDIAAAGAVAELRAVVDPGPATYIFDESLFPTNETEL